METGSPRFTLNKVQLLKIGRGALYAAGGAATAYLLQLLPNVDLGQWTPAVVALASIVLNAAIKFFSNNAPQ